jgi:hypothetical protein
MTPNTDTTAAAAGHTVMLITAAGCHLCDDARDKIADLADELGFAWQEFDLAEDPKLHERYRTKIPVVLVDGRLHGFWGVDPARLRAALDGSAGSRRHVFRNRKRQQAR